jgi:hypothetical protein
MQERWMFASGDGVNDPAIDAKRRTSGRRGLRRDSIDNHVGDFVDGRSPLNN